MNKIIKSEYYPIAILSFIASIFILSCCIDKSCCNNEDFTPCSIETVNYEKDNTEIAYNGLAWPLHVTVIGNDEFKLMVEAAASRWNDELQQDIVLVDEEESRVFITQKKGYYKTGNAGGAQMLGGCRITIDADKGTETTIAHELGHCLGFTHSDEECSLMNHKTREDAVITEKMIDLIHEKLELNR